MDILILGGTVFVGRALTDAALAAGHRVTHFNRGRSGADDPRVATVHGDRNDDQALRALAGRGPWDAVLDTSGYLPQVVQKSLDALAPAVRTYAFISTISVYADFSRPGLDEASAIREPPAVLPEALVMELYGELKAGCEQRVQATAGGRALVVRPGLIVGPRDPTDRFTWWPHRVALGGEVVAPGVPALPVQFIDARDLAAFTIGLLERGERGVFNATGLPRAISLGDVIEASRDVSHADARVRWVDEAFLLERGVAPWKDLPLWIPSTDASRAGMSFIDVHRALGAGLTFRPLELTVRDTLAWSTTRRDHAWKAGLSSAREAELLKEWTPRKARRNRTRKTRNDAKDAKKGFRNGTPKTPR